MQTPSHYLQREQQFALPIPTCWYQKNLADQMQTIADPMRTIAGPREPRYQLVEYTVNVDIFACINFLRFTKMGNFTHINIRVLCIIGSLG